MLDHVSIMVTDLDRVERFYDAALAALDVPKAARDDDRLDYGLRCDDSRPDRSYLPILLDNLSERASRRHWCFKAADRAIMDAFWTAGLANGGQDGGVTGLRPRCHLNILPRSFWTRAATGPRRCATGGSKLSMSGTFSEERTHGV